MLRVMKRPIIDGFIQTQMSLSEVRTALIARKNLQQFSFLTPTGERLYLQQYVNDTDKPYELPIYQLRLNRQDYREKYTEYDIVNFYDDSVNHYVYQDLKPYTFEEYYIDKHMDRFCPYLGYFYDPYTGKIFATSASIFQFMIDDEVIDVSDIETWQTKNLSTKIKSIKLNEGLYAELTYS